MNGIIDQPIFYDIWKIIFKELSIQDLLTCRLVNKLFKNFSDHTNGINKLIIGQPDFDEYVYYWYYNYKQIEDKDIISLKCFRTIQELSIFNLDTNLKYLKIYDQQFKLEELSNLINLEHLEFSRNHESDYKQIINLNNLKGFVSNYNLYFQLNAPKLEKIIFYFIDKIKLKSNPESIKHLITPRYDNRLEIFKNLEIIELEFNDQPINENVLTAFKQLKKLKINLGSTINYSNERIKNFLIKILNDKIKLKRSIDIYLKGVKIENIDKFNELISIGESYWKFRLNNYDLLDLPFIHYLRYNKLEESVNDIKNDLPSSFFDKFIHINWIGVDNVRNIDDLNWFLNKLKYLIRLEINYNVLLGEVFYNNLPNTIKYLEIYNSENIDYKFILKLSKLIKFSTHVSKDLFDLVFESFLNLKYLKEFRFYFENKEIIIEKKDKYFYLNYEKRELNYNQLIDECNKIRSK